MGVCGDDYVVLGVCYVEGGEEGCGVEGAGKDGCGSGSSVRMSEIYA